MVEIREAPWPVRWAWSYIEGEKMHPPCWFTFDPLCERILPGDRMTVVLSNGQTIIVRAKK